MSAADAIGYVNLVAFGVLAVVALRQWRRRRDPAAVWAAFSFGALGLVVALGQVVPEEPDELAEHVVQRIDIAILLVFPYLLYRFTTAFDTAPRGLEWAIGLVTLALVVWTFALPDIPGDGDPRPAWFRAYLVAFLLHWTALSIIAAVRLWRAGRGEPSVARRRMRLLAAAAGALTLALFLAAANADDDAGLAAASGALGTLSAVGFLLGLAPPELVRMAWRRPENERLRAAIQRLVTIAQTPAEVVDRVLPHMAQVVGARAVAFLAGGEIVRTHGIAEEDAERAARGETVAAWADARLIRLDVDGNSLLVWTSPYAPFFGAEELELLKTLLTLTGLAVDRVRLFEQEREARLALEQADELKTNFVALAAHELRTPVTTIHGFAVTLNRLAGRLSEEQVIELRETLERESTRLAALLEQLLDLSRLDAAAIEIRPRRFRVRERVEQLVETAAAGQAHEVAIDVPSELEVTADVNAFDRIVSNLVTNALRYGKAPVAVSADRSDGEFRLAVEDRGSGVAEGFVPLLFERFTRADGSRSRSVGSGLGLAIARSYARAHDGDLFYEPAEPTGARFRLVLPVE